MVIGWFREGGVVFRVLGFRLWERWGFKVDA